MRKIEGERALLKARARGRHWPYAVGDSYDHFDRKPRARKNGDHHDRRAAGPQLRA